MFQKDIDFLKKLQDLPDRMDFATKFGSNLNTINEPRITGQYALVSLSYIDDTIVKTIYINTIIAADKLINRQNACIPCLSIMVNEKLHKATELLINHPDSFNTDEYVGNIGKVFHDEVVDQV